MRKLAPVQKLFGEVVRTIREHFAMSIRDVPWVRIRNATFTRDYGPLDPS